MGPQNQETTEPMWRSKDVCIPSPPPPPPPSKNTFFFNFESSIKPYSSKMFQKNVSNLAR